MNTPTSPEGGRPPLSLNARTLLAITALLIYGATTWLVVDYVSDYRTALVWLQMMSFAGFAIAVLALLRPWKNKVLTYALIASLATAGVMTPRKAKATVAIACAIAVTVIIVGFVVCIKLNELCKKIPPSHPEEPPENPSTTNSAADIKISADVAPMPRVSLEDDNAYDGYNYQFQHRDPWGNNYTAHFSTTLQSSTNLPNWKTECGIKGWVSSAFMLTVYSTNGVPFYTNICTLNAVNISPQCVLPGYGSEWKLFRLSKL